MSGYPECEKLAKVSDKSQVVGEFLEWLNDQGLTICRIDPEDDFFWPDHKTINQRLADFFGIDLDKVEAERRAMLDEIRTKQ